MSDALVLRMKSSELAISAKACHELLSTSTVAALMRVRQSVTTSLTALPFFNIFSRLSRWIPRYACRHRPGHNQRLLAALRQLRHPLPLLPWDDHVPETHEKKMKLSQNPA